MKIIKNNPRTKSETLLKKYWLIQLLTQLNPVIYSSGLWTLKFGFAPAFDHNSYQSFILLTVSDAIDHWTLSKQVNEIGYNKQPVLLKYDKITKDIKKNK